MVPVDILRLIVKYVGPFQIHNFFRDHGLNFDLSFSYDASKNPGLTANVHAGIFCYFPNIRLVGININFVDVWDERDIFIQIGLNDMRHLRKIHFGNICDFKSCHFRRLIWDWPMHMLTNLRWLKMPRCVDLDISFLKGCPKMRDLDLSQCKVVIEEREDILESMVHLKRLVIEGKYWDRNVHYLNSLKKLEYFGIKDDDDIMYCDEPFDMSGLGKSERLRCVEICAKNWSNIVGLNECRNLRKILLIGCKMMRGMEFMSNCESLRVVHIVGCGDLWLCAIPTITELVLEECDCVGFKVRVGRGEGGDEGFERLQVFEAINCRKLDLICLEKSKDLDLLRLVNCRYLEHVDSLSSCVSLVNVNIMNSAILNLNFLNGFQKLKFVRIIDCRVQNIEGLRKCGNLMQLEIISCWSVESIVPLMNCAKLEVFRLENSNVQVVEVLANLAELRSLRLIGCNRIESVVALSMCAKLGDVMIVNCRLCPDRNELLI